MEYITYSDDLSKISTVILIKEPALNKKKIKQFYLEPAGVDPEEVLAIGLPYHGKKVPPAKERKVYLEDILSEIKLNTATKLLYVADGDYFKTLCKVTKTTPHYGTTIPCAIKGYECFQVALGLNYGALKYNPTQEKTLNLTLETIGDPYKNIGSDIIKVFDYPKSIEEIKDWLEQLKHFEVLSVDIEGYGLEFWKCGIGTIGFAWDKYSGIAFDVDQNPFLAQEIRALLKKFFQEYKGKLLVHNAGFDFKVLTYQLFMKSFTDIQGMIEGISTFVRNFEDTKLIAYLATNNTVENKLSLKHLAQSFAGNYAVEVEDITKVDPKALLQYNLTDCLSTWFVHDEYYEVMVEDKQKEIYETLFKPVVKNLLQIELTGMPINMPNVLKAEKELTALADKHMTTIQGSHIVKDFFEKEKERKAAKDNLILKKITRLASDFDHLQFNPNSNDQLQRLLYGELNLPVIDLTKNKNPAVGGKTLKKLRNHTDDIDVRNLLTAIKDLSNVMKVLTSFIPAFKEAVEVAPEDWRLFGNFNLGGTKSGRLSSSNP